MPSVSGNVGAVFNGGAISTPLTVTTTAMNAIPLSAHVPSGDWPVLALYNDTFDTDPADPVYSIEVDNDGFCDHLIDATVASTQGFQSSNIVNRFEGRPIFGHNFVPDQPADTQLSASGFGLWLDPTPGTTVLHIKAKDSGGTVRTASIALS